MEVNILLIFLLFLIILSHKKEGLLLNFPPINKSFISQFYSFFSFNCLKPILDRAKPSATAVK